MFHSVIVITDRTVLDSQLQDTIYQFEHREGVVGRINREEGDGTKSEKLAEALIMGQPIIIVTIQTFPFVLEAIQKNATHKQRNYTTYDTACKLARKNDGADEEVDSKKARKELIAAWHDDSWHLANPEHPFAYIKCALLNRQRLVDKVKQDVPLACVKRRGKIALIPLDATPATEDLFLRYL